MIYSKLTSLALAFLLGLQLTVAQPHGKRHHRKDELFARKSMIAYVDQNGNPIASPAAGVLTTPASTTPIVLDTSDSTGKGVTQARGLNKPAIVYTPYNADGTCKTTAAVLADIGRIYNYGFGMVRIYGVDCNQVPNVLAATKPLGMKVFLGVYDMGQCETQLAQLIQSVAGDWSSIYAVSIGNEIVNSGALSAGAMVVKVNQSRVTLRAAGFTGAVVIVDTWVAIIANPALCQNSDFVAANCHPFFDGNVLPGAAGQFMADSIAKLRAACGGKQVLITETGWPHQGKPNGQCVPGVQQQHDAISSIHSVVGGDGIYFTSADDLWKADNPATSSAEKYWGILDFTIFSS